MSTIVSPHPGGHRRRRFARRPRPAPPDDPGLVLAEAADGDMTLAELRGFLDRAEVAAWEAGLVPGGLRWRAAVRHAGAVRAAWVTIQPP